MKKDGEMLIINFILFVCMMILSVLIIIAHANTLWIVLCAIFTLIFERFTVCSFEHLIERIKRLENELENKEEKINDI